MVKLALALLATVLVQAASPQTKKNQSGVEALVEELAETFPEAQLEALALEQTLLEELDQALLDPPAQALVQRVRDILQAQGTL